MRKAVSIIFILFILQIMSIERIFAQESLVDVHSEQVTVNFAPQTYFVDCDAGSNNNDGVSQSSPWRSLDRVNEAMINPGDTILFKRDCVYAGRLWADWHGTEDQKIIVSAYGSGDLPKIQNKVSDIEDDLHHINVRISGSFIVVENLQTTMVQVPTDPNCENQTRGYYVGFGLIHDADNGPLSAQNNLVQNVKAVNHTIGIFIGPGAGNNVVRHSHLQNNNVMQAHTLGRNDELGAWGMLVNGDNNQIAYNYFERNRAWCSYDGIERPSNSIELFESSNNTIHHNVSVNDRVFSEMGSSGNRVSENNLFAFNLAISDLNETRFIVSRGSSHQFGPVNRTRAFNNTVYYTGERSQGLVCGAGCDSDILIARNNLIWAEEKVVFASDAIVEEHNLFWNRVGEPFVQLEKSTISATSILADPQFTDTLNNNYRPASSSEAIGNAKNLSWIETRGVPTPGEAAEWDIGVVQTFGDQNLLPIQVTNIVLDEFIFIPSITNFLNYGEDVSHDFCRNH